jgi:hypothetical protein
MSKRRFPIKRIFGTCLLLLVALDGFMSLQRVKHQAFEIVSDTLPGLVDAGMANSAAAEDFNCILLALIASNHQARAEFCAQADAAEVETDNYLKLYGNSIFETEDKGNFNHLMNEREAYLTHRREIMALIDRGEDKQAFAQYKSALLPAYSQYMDTGRVLLDYNTRQGKARGQSILHFSSLTQYAVAAFAVALFILGFVIGIFRYNPLLTHPPEPMAHKPIIGDSRSRLA